MAERTEQEMMLRYITDADDWILGTARIINQLTDLRSGVEGTKGRFDLLNISAGNFLAKLGYNLFQAPIRAFRALSQKVKEFAEFAKGATMQAARIEVQWRTLSLTAGNAGEKIGDMAKHVNMLRSYGIQTGEALESVSQFLATGLPVENITELARRAQDMAVVIGSDSTDAFRRFNTFLQTGNSMWIRTMGITKTATQMLKEYAKTQGLVVAALTDRQRKEALVQGLMKATLAYEGSYEEAMKDPYKRWTSLPRLISNATEVLGHMFVPMMGTAVDAATTLLEKFEGIFRVTKKGAYARIAEDLGKATEDLTKEEKVAGIEQYFGQWTDFAYNVRASVEMAAEWVTDAFQELVGKASGWGEGMGSNLTEGIISAFQNTVLPAIVQVTGWIADFLAPGSAPKKGPLSTIDEWGLDLMRTYMKGWAKIDFQVFNQVAGTLQSAIQAAFTSAGKTGKADKLGLQEALMAGRQLAGRVTTEMGTGAQNLASMLGGAAGPLTGDLVKYIGLVQKYKAATQGVAAARERLARAEAWVAEATQNVNRAREQAAELEDWVAEASKKVEAVRLRMRKLEMEWAEIPERFVRGRKRQLEMELMAAEAEQRRRQEVMETAKKQIEAAQVEEQRRKSAIDVARQQVAAAEQMAKAVQEEVSLQQARLQELIKQVELQAQIDAGRAAAVEKEVEGVEKIKNAWEGVFDPTKLEEAKERMKGLLAPLMPQITQIGENFAKIWEGLKELPGRVMDFIASLKKIKQEWWDPLPEWLKKLLLGTIILNFATHGAIGSVLSSLIGAAFTGAGLIPGVGWAIAAGGLALYITLKPFLNEEVRQEWANAWGSLTGKGGDPLAAIGEAAERTLEHTPIMSTLLEWADSLGKAKPDMEEAADAAIARPLIDAAERAHGEIVGESILPDLIRSVLDWFTRLSEDVIAPMTAFSDNTILPFDDITVAWTTNLTLLTERFDNLIGRVSVLATALVGLPPLPEDLTLFSEGKLQVVTVNLQGATFGSGITAGDVDGWMHDAMADLMG